MERQDIKNPFSTNMARPVNVYKPDLTNKVAAPGKDMRTGQELVNILADFAGVAGDAWEKQMQKKIKADKIIQTDRAFRGERYSDDATVAGARANTLIGIKNAAAEYSSNVLQFGSENHTDKEYEQYQTDQYNKKMQELGAKYPNFKSDQNMQGLFMTSLREKTPALTQNREANKIKFEIKNRVNTAIDAVSNLSKNTMFSTMKSDAQVKQFNAIFAKTQLTPSQKDLVLETAIAQTKSPALIKLSKSINNNRSTSVYERSAKIKTIEKQEQQQSLLNDSINIADKRFNLTTQFLDGKISKEDFKRSSNKFNEVYKNKFMTGAQYTSVINQRNKIIAKSKNISDAVGIILSSDVTNASPLTDKQIQAGYSKIKEIRNGQLVEQAKKQGLNQDDTMKYIQTGAARTVQLIGDKSMKIDTLDKDYVSSLRNLSTINLSAVAVQKTSKTGIPETDLPQKAKEAIFIYDHLSDTAKIGYLKGLNDINKARTLKAFFRYRDMKLPLTAALQRAQSETANPQPIDFKKVKKGTDDVLSNMEFSWFRPDISDIQRPWLERKITNDVMLDADSNSDDNVKLVSKYYKSQWTTLDNDIRVEGNPRQLQILTGLHPKALSAGFKAFKDSKKKLVLSKLDARGWKMDDVFVATNPKTGIMFLVGKDGQKIIGTTERLSDLSKYYQNRKIVKVPSNPGSYEMRNKNVKNVKPIDKRVNRGQRYR